MAGNGGVDVGDARGDARFAIARGALLGAADDGFQAGDGQALADAGALVDALVLASQKGDLLDDFAKVIRDQRRRVPDRARPRLPAR